MRLNLSDILLIYFLKLYNRNSSGRFRFSDIFKEFKENGIIKNPAHLSRELARLRRENLIVKPKNDRYFSEIIITEKGLESGRKAKENVDRLINLIGISDKKQKVKGLLKDLNDVLLSCFKMIQDEIIYELSSQNVNRYNIDTVSKDVVSSALDIIYDKISEYLDDDTQKLIG